MSTTPKSQKDLDIEIAQLEQDLIKLKRRRNMLSPVSQLPPELLTRIFYLSLRFIEADGLKRAEIHPEVTRLAITHVSHDWRTVGHESPELWSEIHVRDTTKMECLDFSRKMAKNLPLHAEAYNMINKDGIAGVRHIFQTETERLKGAALYGHIDVMRLLLQELKTCREVIEVLDIGISTKPFRTYPGFQEADTFFDLPKLKELTIYNWNTLLIPLSFQPFALVKFEIYFTVGPPATHIMHAFLACLRNVGPSLRYLKLVFGNHAIPQVFSLNDTVMPLIDMPRLEQLSLMSSSLGVVAALFTLIRLPSSVREIYLHQSVPDTVGNHIEEIATALQHGLAVLTSPQYLQIKIPHSHLLGAVEFVALRNPSVRGRHLIGTTHIEVVLSLLSSSRSQGTPCSDESRNLPIPSFHSHGWLYCQLQTIVIDLTLPLSFWRSIACIPPLMELRYRVTSLDDNFIQTLREAVEHGGRPFPSLTRIIPVFKGTELRWDINYARNLATQLSQVRAKDNMGIKRFEFLECSSAIDDTTRCLLQSVAKDVVWQLHTCFETPL
ncbi:hypothetical protein DFP72DRAFT_912005 [Ephemerocybe angulata]|uniref:F-box domain-containing protein n=1 Tax=Ephemerocybe angulata TaxID=980116 RepID=A0A8H6HMS4_9AGAR|nr:hypothetical protein DFP72DRAFT_912005 [Tulosesus angulatus]